MVAVVACLPLEYDGQRFAKGDTFGASPLDALVMRAHKQVTWGRLRVYHPPARAVLVPPAPPVVEDEPKPRRRSYRRRDLEPESLGTPDEP